MTSRGLVKTFTSVRDQVRASGRRKLARTRFPWSGVVRAPECAETIRALQKPRSERFARCAETPSPYGGVPGARQAGRRRHPPSDGGLFDFGPAVDRLVAVHDPTTTHRSEPPR